MDLLFGITIPDLSAPRPRKNAKPAAKPAQGAKSPSMDSKAAKIAKTRTLAANDTEKPERDRPAKGRAPRLPLDSFTPRRRVTYIGRQVCPCCERETLYIAGDLLEYSQHDRVAGVRTIRTRAFDSSDYRWTNLPRAKEYLTPERVTCVECLELDAHLDAILTGVGPVQFPLFV